MQWFEGNIPEAIAESQRRKVVFVVYVEDQSEDSQKMNSALNEPQVGNACSQEACIAIKLNVNSQQCQQFSALYPLVCVPVIYFIGNKGVPLEVVGGAVSADALVNKATSAFEAYKASTEAEISAQNQTQDSCVANNSSEEQPARQEQPAAAGAASNLSLDDRVRRANQLMEETRQKKVEKAKEDEKNKEAQRRKQGQEMLKAKEELDSRKTQMIQQKIKEDKAKERAHREEVRQQIARDKAERDANRLREVQERQNTTAGAPDASFSAPPSTSHAPERSVDSKSCANTRLQFRFPDGSSVTNTFPADALLEAARQFIVSHSNASNFSSGVTLLMTFPRRELSDDDLMKTLRDLGLTPSSTLIVVPKKQGGSVQGRSSVSDLVLWILAPLFALINFIKIILLGSPIQPRGAHRENSNPNRQTSQPRPGTQTNSSGIRRREGGIHRLRQTEDDDDENNTWNGNSTQQM